MRLRAGLLILLLVLGALAHLLHRVAPVEAQVFDPYGSNFVRIDSRNRIRCTITSTATTSTLVTGCAAPGAGLSIYINAISWSSSILSSTTNFMRIQSGTGGTCSASIDVLYDAYTSAAFGTETYYPNPPIKVQANEEVCFVHAAAGTRLVNITGFIGP